MKLDQEMRVDGQSIRIIKDKETPICIEYFFEADLWCEDPRFQSRFMKIGECRGLFRLDKEKLSTELLFQWQAMMLEAGLTRRHRRCLRSFVPLGLGRTELSSLPDNQAHRFNIRRNGSTVRFGSKPACRGLGWIFNLAT